LDIQEAHLDGCWDLVFSSLLLEHVPDDVVALRNMQLMTGKYILLTAIGGDLQRYENWEQQMGHVRNYRIGELEEKLEQVGFEVVRVVRWGFPFYSPLGRTLQNAMKVGTKFSITTRLVAEIMYYLYFLNSHSRGDLIVVLATA